MQRAGKQEAIVVVAIARERNIVAAAVHTSEEGGDFHRTRRRPSLMGWVSWFT